MKQHLDPLIGNAVLARDEQREETLKTEDVPRIDQRSAVDAPMQVALRLLQQFEGFGHLFLLDDPPRRVNAAQHLALEPRRRARDDGRLTQARLGIAHPSEQVCELTALHLLGTVLREKHVQRLPHVSERLPSLLGMPGESLRACSRHRLQKPRIELVALTGDSRQQRRQCDTRIVAVGTVAADRRRHQDRAAQDGRDVEQRLVGIDSLLLGRPIEQRVENHLPHDEPAIATLQVDLIWIPFTEQIVGPLVRRMDVIVSPQIDCQFVELFQIEMGIGQQITRHFAKQFEDALDQVVILPMRHTRSPQEDRQRSKPFVGIWLRLSAVLQDGDRSIAKEVVQTIESTGDDAIFLVPRSALFEHRFKNLRDEERLLQLFRLQMEEQVAMVFTVRGQGVVNGQ